MALPVHQTVGSVLCSKCGIPMPSNVVQDHTCESCSRVEANPDKWVASVQLRQNVPHRLAFFYLEQLIIKHDAAARAMRIEQMDEGVYFFFSRKKHAQDFLSFITGVSPIKFHHDRLLVSHDSERNIRYYRTIYFVEICPICRDDLIYLPPIVAARLGNLGPLVICTEATDFVGLLDPLTLRHCKMNGDKFWRWPFWSLLTSRQLVEYIILDIKKVSSETIGGSKYVFADARVARVASKNGPVITIRTHLGHILKQGDCALGYYLYGANDIGLEKYEGRDLPEAILIKKSYKEQQQRKDGKPRSWKLKSLEIDVDDKGRSDELEYELFLRDLEENPELRCKITVSKQRIPTIRNN